MRNLLGPRALWKQNGDMVDFVSVALVFVAYPFLVAVGLSKYAHRVYGTVAFTLIGLLLCISWLFYAARDLSLADGFGEEEGVFAFGVAVTIGLCWVIWSFRATGHLWSSDVSDGRSDD